MQKRIFIRLLLGVGSLALVVGFGGGPLWERTESGIIRLENPGFAAWAAQSEEEESGVSFLEREAGIAAYVKVDQTIDIKQLRKSFKVVEQLEDDYLTGQIAIPNLEENWHPRLFITRDGWVVAYYPRSEPTSIMLVLWIRGAEATLTNTTLELAIREVLRAAGVSPVPEIQYYHFRHTTADRLMLIREDASGEDTFQITIPSELQVLDATWIANDSVGGWSGINVDETNILGGHNWGVRFGDFLPQLKRDTPQTVRVWGGNYGFVLLYKSP